MLAKYTIYLITLEQLWLCIWVFAILVNHVICDIYVVNETSKHDQIDPWHILSDLCSFCILLRITL